MVGPGHGGPAEDLTQPRLHLRPAAGRHQVAPGRLESILLGRTGGRPPQRLRVGGAAEAELRGEAGAGAEVGLAGLAVPGVPGVLGAVVLVVGGGGNVLAAWAVLDVRDAGGAAGDGRRQQFAVEALAPARLADGLRPARLQAVEPQALVAAAEEREARPPREPVGDRRRLGGDFGAELGLVVHPAGEAEVLPHEHALRVAAVVERLALGDPAAPDADRVGAGGERVVDPPLGRPRVDPVEQRVAGDPVEAAAEDLPAVDRDREAGARGGVGGVVGAAVDLDGSEADAPGDFRLRRAGSGACTAAARRGRAVPPAGVGDAELRGGDALPVRLRVGGGDPPAVRVLQHQPNPGARRVRAADRDGNDGVPATVRGFGLHGEGVDAGGVPLAERKRPEAAGVQRRGPVPAEAAGHLAEPVVRRDAGHRDRVAAVAGGGFGRIGRRLEADLQLVALGQLPAEVESVRAEAVVQRPSASPLRTTSAGPSTRPSTSSSGGPPGSAVKRCVHDQPQRPIQAWSSQAASW